MAESVKAGVWAAGATPREFVISSICTSMAGDDRYHLAHRDLVAGYIEAVACTNLFDGMAGKKVKVTVEEVVEEEKEEETEVQEEETEEADSNEEGTKDASEEEEKEESEKTEE